MCREGERKLMGVVRGGMYDVVVDIRSGWGRYGEWERFMLSAGNYLEFLVR
ncbi:dTDP-4-dehydrorhamnose 3,5-epimerase family protein, partial [Paenibacillus sp. Y412MC10]|uniref:dTDP-4-dehydrorhamnose 3,5-epimerase family protein n=1 Tax=Geobacillus sp. (strain Y412MC10) TaxID=481743 RepID=UPI0011A32B43